MAATVLIGLFVALNIRELGHTAAARLAGDHDASYELRCAPSGFGCNHLDATGMSVFAKLAVTCGGCLVTQSITWSLVLLRRRVDRRWRPVLTPLVAVFSLAVFITGVLGHRGMRERATLHDGVLHVGPNERGYSSKRGFRCHDTDPARRRPRAHPRRHPDDPAEPGRLRGRRRGRGWLSTSSWPGPRRRNGRTSSIC
ncbi:hypothetical protein [Umezawaea sp. Da 62-37]|uniref:hypothetical protein n=1 Tax=Umezawaea sp. Da 62-37 TaxID=3075927 RepID=UPI0037DD1553